MDKNAIKSLYILIIILSLCVFNYGGDSQVAAEEELTIAFVPRSLDNPIFLDTFEAAQKKAHELGVKLEWVAPFSFNTERQLEVINNLIRREVDGMIISVDDVEPVRRVISKAIDQGIAVATFDADCPGSERLFHIGIDNTRAGLAAGRALIDIIKERGLEEEELDTMIMTGVPEALNLKERISGFLQATDDRINLNINDTLYNYDDIKLANNLLEDYVKEHPELDVIFFVGGWPFYVPAEAMPNFKNWALNGGIAVGIDIFYDALVLQQEGLIQYLVGQDLASMGAEGLEYMVDYIQEGKEPPPFIETGLEHADSDNLDNLLKIHKPWLVK